MSEPTGGAPGTGGNAGAQAVETRFHDALAHHRTGQLDQAQGLYEDILRDKPDHADALHMLGVLAHQQGRNQDAKRLISDAIGVNGDSGFYHNNLGEVKRMLGELDEAAGCYRRAIELEPTYAQAHNNLAMVAFQLGRADEAEKEFREALRIEPNDPGIHNNLAVVLQAAGNLDEAVLCLRRSLELAPEQAEVCNNLGAATLAQGKYEEAEQHLREALRIEPALANAQFNLSRMYAEQGRQKEAVEAARKAIDINPNYPDCYIALANAQRAMGELEESLGTLRAGVAINPTHPLLLNDLGVCQLTLGRFEEADASFRRALHAEPRLAVAHENLARARRFVDQDRAKIDHVESLAAEGTQDEQGQAHLHFALGKMLDDVGEYERAMKHFASGNALEHARTRFDAAAMRSFVERSRSLFDAAFIEEKRPLGNPSEMPIFIVGMLRSGTTLVEQILASHPVVHAAGELEFFRNASARMAPSLGDGTQPYPECLRALDAGIVDSLSNEYLGWLGARMGGKTRFTDKNPLNFEHLGLMMLAFPNARVIHCRRDPMDVCLSVYMQHFSERHEFAYSFADIAEYHHQYEQLVSHWHGVFPGRIHDVDYEDLVANIEPETRKMLDYLGLEWNSGCLEFHKTLRPVGTASHWQVRQPLYTRSVGRWRNYEPWLGELREAIDDRRSR